MTATLDAVMRKKAKSEPSAEQKLAQELVTRAREQGVSLTGPDGLLKQLTKTVLETALNQEITEHLGFRILVRGPFLIFGSQTGRDPGWCLWRHSAARDVGEKRRTSHHGRAAVNTWPSHEPPRLQVLAVSGRGRRG
jgi:hypothetical protein